MTAPAPSSLLQHPGVATRVVVDGSGTDGTYALLELRAPAGSGAPLHLHEREDQLLVVLAGTLDVLVDGERTEVVAGSCHKLPRGVPHAYVAGPQGALFLSLCTPSGFEDLILAALPEGDAAPDPDDVAALMAAAGVRSLEGRG